MSSNGSGAAAESGIAIVGMSLRVPGARSPNEFFDNLVKGMESIRALSDEELLAAGESPERLRHPRYVKTASILEDMEHFDPDFFGLSPKEAGIMDPQHRQLLECAWEALEDAGHPPEAFDGPIGVWAGCGAGAYFASNIITNHELMEQVGYFLLRHTGNDKDFLSTRISYCLNLRGPSVGVQTACSTSLVAVHYACQSLLSGECDMALAGGVTIELPHRRGYIFEEGEILSPDGHCRAFDHRSAGTVFGSGAGMVVLRRLEDAIAAGDRIYAVIKGSAVNNDGSGKVGYLAPSVEGQAAAIAEALAVAGVEADSIGYVECHGTGTAVGDPIEVAALTEAFSEGTKRKGFCGIGSVKTNIGHLDTAAGVASLIKASLSLRNRKIPPTLNFEKPNPLIDFASTPFFVNDKLRDFPAPPGGGKRRATVNSLGVGGTNAHVVLEEYVAPAQKAPAARPAELLVLSGRNRSAVDAQAKRLLAHLKAHPEQAMPDIAHTLAVARKHFAERKVLVARDREHAIELLEASDPRKVFTHGVVSNASVVFMFPGGGAQYPDMGRRLYAQESVFREHVDKGLALLQKRVSHDPRALLFPAPEKRAEADKALEQPSLQLPLIYIIEYALAQLFMAWGVKPAALIGHSVGENAAAAVAGVFAFEDGLDLVLLRGRLMDEVPEGAMLSVPMAAEDLVPLLGAELDLACINAPNLCVASGPRPLLAKLQAELGERDVEAQWIRIHIAAHSRMLEPVLGRFGDFLRSIKLSAPRFPIISNRTGDVLTSEQARSPEYWVSHLRGTVRFGDGIGSLLKTPGRVFLEVGPGRALTSLARQHPNIAQGQAFIGALPHPDDDTPDTEVFLAAYGRLWAAGVDVDLARARGKEGRFIDLPRYAFQRQRYFIEAQAPRAAKTESPYPERIADRNRWYFAPMFRPDYPDFDPDTSKRTWLVFKDDTGMARGLCQKLRAAGDEVISVFAGDAYQKVSDVEYRLAPEQGTEGYEQLVRDVLASGKTPDRIAHFWLLSNGETFRPGSSFFHRNQERGFFSLLFLAQALSAVDLPSRLHISVITRGMQHVAGSKVMYPDQATVLGPCKVIPRELPGVTCVSIDLAPREEVELPGVMERAKQLAEKLIPHRTDAKEEVCPELDALYAELRLPPENGELCLAKGMRWVRRYERVELPPVERPRLRREGVYLITGGLGGIGLTVARHLAETEHARLVLVNRTPLPPVEEWDSWLASRPADPASSRIRIARQLEAAGAEVVVASGDVADLDRMAEVVAETKARFGALHGVIHAAGVLDDAPIAAKRQASVEAVFGPKVYGTLVLDRVLKDEPLDFFVVFSSTSTAIAAAGQVDYVAANAFLDAYAERARAQGRNVLSLAWGVWAEVGLAASAALRMGADEASKAKDISTHYPLFTSKQVRQGGGVVLNGKLSAKGQWVLDEHRTGNHRAVLPGTGYLELARAALREVGHEGPFAIEDLYFLRALEVPDEGEVELRVRLKPTEQGFAFEVLTKQRLQGGTEGYLLHAQAFLRRFLPKAPDSLNTAALHARCTKREGKVQAEPYRVAQEKHLAFGPRWHNLRSYAFGEGEAVAELRLDQPFEADTQVFGLHPALLDIATGFAIELEPSYGAGENLWVPLSYESVAVYADLTPRLFSHVRSHARTGSDGFARFDITITSPEGRVLVEVKSFSMKAIVGASFESAQLTPKDLEVEAPKREHSAVERAFLHNLSEGITPAEGCAAFRKLIDTLPRARVMVSSMDVRALVRQTDAIVPAKEQASSVSFDRPQLSSEYVAPRNDVERTLAGMWENLLGVSQVGVRDNFFELGGHSLVAVRLFARMKKAFGVDYPISMLIEHPTIEACGKLVAPQAVAGATPEAQPEVHGTRFKHLVPMNSPGGEKQGRLPFFLVAGMFGNVLNLRHLASLVGEDRPFHGVQARGLLGEEDPHETFEEMARDYLKEIRAVQPHGPYLLGGFSGGGITAFEMARQLIAEGEQVPLIVLLDTPVPLEIPLTRGERLSIHRQNIERQGLRYLSSWVEGKFAYRRELRARKDQEIGQAAAGQDARFRSQLIEAAFYRALGRYKIEELPVHLALFRPRLKAEFAFGPGRAINKDRRRIYSDNGWGPFAPRVDVVETPGDHDSMVLEPNVRILATRLRAALDDAEKIACRAADRPGGSQARVAASPVRD
jgi:acyl transferase domain-containing protein/thioesterase domain-containing protein/aryl carrier-like protein